MVIITDSASDLPKEIQEEFQLHVIPTPVVIDEKDYLDGVSIHTKEFYEILDDKTRDVKTYHINPEMFENAFRPYAEKGESVLYLCFSTGIAGTYNAANIAKENLLEEYPKFDLTIFDSKSASIGFGLLVYKLLCLNRQGAEKEELLAAANYYREHIRHVFTVRTLAYLIKGGRLSKFKGTIGETLDMKPILIVNKEGSLQVLNTVRGQKKSIKSLVEYVLEHGVDLDKQTIAICHGEDETALGFARKLIEEKAHPEKELIGTVGCAIGAHTGRGIVGICFLDAPDWEKK
ncbi:MAG: DegV family protein [Roseburia sp.]|nr:DegV family protein [Roseburia sp.]MCM1279050.1 DegV family protein [Robinsoniella sp.]